MEGYNVGIVGASGVVGREIIFILEKRSFPVKNLRLFASEKSIGKSIEYNSSNIVIESLNERILDNLDIAFFCATPEVSRTFYDIMLASKCIAIDSTGYFWHRKDIPMIVSSVNDNIDLKNKKIISTLSGPSTILSLSLKPVVDYIGLERVSVCSYQSISSLGIKAMDELMSEIKAWFEFRYDRFQPVVLPNKIAFNCIPCVGDFLSSGYTTEEENIKWQLKALFNDKLRINASCAFVPVFRGHSFYINIQTARTFNLEFLKQAFEKYDFIKIVNNAEPLKCPQPAVVSGSNNIHVGRIRIDETLENSFNMWVVADNIRSGIALNAVKIAEKIIK